MKIINFGSLNIDRVYQTGTFVNPGETVFAESFDIHPGGKGLNQSIAAARAGAEVLHVGMTGKDGIFLKELLDQAGVDTTHLIISDAPSGHAVIEVDSSGENRIIVYGGTNQMLREDAIDTALEDSEAGDIVLLQNETNLIGSIIKKAHGKGCRIAFNPSPFPGEIEKLPLEWIDFYLVNEIEGAQLAGMAEDASYEDILHELSRKFPEATIVMTLGGQGALCWYRDEVFHQDIYPVDVRDSTAAGDTFSGYFLSAVCAGASILTALDEAAAAAAIAVSRDGAAPSIPNYEETAALIRKTKSSRDEKRG